MGVSVSRCASLGATVQLVPTRGSPRTASGCFARLRGDVHSLLNCVIFSKAPPNALATPLSTLAPWTLSLGEGSGPQWDRLSIKSVAVSIIPCLKSTLRCSGSCLRCSFGVRFGHDGDAFTRFSGQPEVCRACFSDAKTLVVARGNLLLLIDCKAQQARAHINEFLPAHWAHRHHRYH